MQIPELAERHKEIIPSIVKNILSMAIEFKQRAQERLADEQSREADQNIHEEQLDYINWDLFTTRDELYHCATTAVRMVNLSNGWFLR